MYDFPDSSAIFDIFEVGIANSHISVPNHLATPKLAIFEYWRHNWRSGGRQFANLAIFANIPLFIKSNAAGESDFHFFNKINFWLKGL